MVEVIRAVVVVTILAIPLTLSVVALLDAARRPGWVWAFAERSQVAWMAVIMFGIVVVPLGLVVAFVYLGRVRAQLAAIEAGRLDGR